MSNLSLLVSLKLRKNQLTTVVPEVFSLESLSLLDLTGNAIRELPEDNLGAAITLKALLLSGMYIVRSKVMKIREAGLVCMLFVLRSQHSRTHPDFQ